MAFKYAFNTWVYGSFPVWMPAYTLDEAIRRLARIGYDGIEIGCAAPHAWPAHLDAGRRRALRDLLKSEGLPCVSLLPAPGGGPGNNPASPLTEERTATIAHYKEVVDLGQQPVEVLLSFTNTTAARGAPLAGVSQLNAG